MKKVLLRPLAAILCGLFAGNISAKAQTTEGPEFLYKEINRSVNVLSNENNPVFLTFDPLSNLVDISVYGLLDRGNYHDVDASSKVNGLGANIEGRHRFRQVDCYGRIDYLNSKAYDRNWNSTLFLSPHNPFILGDSIKSDFSTERFFLSGIASYRPIEKLTLALRLNYLTGSTANQHDPRPKTNSMRFSIDPGIHYRISDRFSVGAFGKIEIFNEKITHTAVNFQKNHYFFRFRGLGDYTTATTNLSTSYPRDYNGNRYTGGLQFILTHSATYTNLLEAAWEAEREKSRDGGRTFTWYGGEYKGSGLTVTDRFILNKGNLRHNITVHFSHFKTENTWFDQTEFVDWDNNGQLAYEIQDSYILNEERIVAFGADYRLDLQRNNRPHLTVTASGKYYDAALDFYEGDGFYRNYNRAEGLIGIEKHFPIGKTKLSAGLTGSYSAGIDSDLHAKETSYDLVTAFEYLTADYVGAGANVTLSVPVDFSGFKTVILVFAEYTGRFYNGNNQYSSKLDHTKYHQAVIGAGVLF